MTMGSVFKNGTVNIGRGKDKDDALLISTKPISDVPGPIPKPTPVSLQRKFSVGIGKF